MKQTNGSYVFDQEKGAVYGIMANIYTDELQSGIEMGWRQMLPTDDSVATILAISLLDMELSDPNYRLGTKLSVHATLSCEHCAETKIAGNIDGSVPGYFYRFDEVFYYSSWRSAAASGSYTPWMFNLQFYDGEVLLPYIASMILPTTIDGGYQRSYLYIWDGQSEVGRIAIDIRPFTAALMIAEMNARKLWQPANALQLSQQLGIQMPEGMNALFPNVLNKIGS